MFWLDAGMAGFSIISGLQQGETIRANAEVSKQINEANADLIMIDAHNAELDGYSQEARYQDVIDKTISNQRVGFAANNIDVNFGTAAEIQDEAKLVGTLNKIDIVNQAHDKAMGLESQARSVRLQGYLNNAQAQGIASATQNSTILKGLGEGISGYGKYAKPSIVSNERVNDFSGGNSSYYSHLNSDWENMA